MKIHYIKNKKKGLPCRNTTLKLECFHDIKESPVGKIAKKQQIAEKAACRSVFLTIWQCNLNSELTKIHSFRQFFFFADFAHWEIRRSNVMYWLPNKLTTIIIWKSHVRILSEYLLARSQLTMVTEPATACIFSLPVKTTCTSLSRSVGVHVKKC